jgi:hypothetical protein
MVKSGKGGDGNLKRFFLVWLKLKKVVRTVLFVNEMYRIFLFML